MNNQQNKIQNSRDKDIDLGDPYFYQEPPIEVFRPGKDGQWTNVWPQPAREVVIPIEQVKSGNGVPRRIKVVSPSAGIREVPVGGTWEKVALS